LPLIVRVRASAENDLGEITYSKNALKRIVKGEARERDLRTE
jgi:hypothetical protein